MYDMTGVWSMHHRVWHCRPMICCQIIVFLLTTTR